MDFIESIKDLTKKCADYGPKVAGNEAATKQALIVPFIEALGYDIYNIEEVFPEYGAAVGDYKDQRVDYAILKDGSPIIIIECKAYGTELNARKCSQLLSYFVGVNPSVAILTDGRFYQFFTAETEGGKMNTRPFMVFDMENPDKNLIGEVKKLQKDCFDCETVINAADELSYSSEFKNILDSQLQNPEDEFLKFFLKHENVNHEKCYEGPITQNVINRFKPILAKTLALYIEGKVNKRLSDALEGAGSKKEEDQAVETPPTAPEPVDNGIVTTEDETQAFYILKSIAGDIVPTDKIRMKDFKQFCNFYFDGLSKLILRLYFNKKPYSIALYDNILEGQKEERIPVDGPEDIYKYKDRILGHIKALMGPTHEGS